MGVSDHRERNDPRSGCADALQEARQQQELEAWREGAGDRADRIERDAEKQRRAAAEPVGNGAEEQLRSPKTDDVEEQHELHPVCVGHTEA
jgi:hypothetical protein